MYEKYCRLSKDDIIIKGSRCIINVKTFCEIHFVRTRLYYRQSYIYIICFEFNKHSQQN